MTIMKLNFPSKSDVFLVSLSLSGIITHS